VNAALSRLTGDFLAFALDLAQASGALIRDAVKQTTEVELKGDLSPVTPIDRAVEAEVRERITSRYPQHGILGEEYGQQQAQAEFVWVLEPIDGTKQFVAGLPTFATLLAVAHEGKPIIGIIDQPVTSERWVGAVGRHTEFNGRRIQTRECKQLADAVMATSAPDYFNPATALVYQRLLEATRWPLYGAGCHAYGQMAAGRIDVGLEADHNAHDYCALVPIVEGAGGVISDWQGAPLTISSRDQFVASGDPRIHGQVLALIETAIG